MVSWPPFPRRAAAASGRASCAIWFTRAGWTPVLAPAQLANLPAGRVVAFRRGMPPVIGRAEQAHRRRDVRTALTGHEPWWARLLAPLARLLARLLGRT